MHQKEGNGMLGFSMLKLGDCYVFSQFSQQPCGVTLSILPYAEKRTIREQRSSVQDHMGTDLSQNPHSFT